MIIELKFNLFYTSFLIFLLIHKGNQHFDISYKLYMFLIIFTCHYHCQAIELPHQKNN